MIYWLAQLLIPSFGIFNVFTYVTTRAMFAAVTALLVGWLIGPAVIRFLRRQGSEQPIREDGPQSHLAKNTTPTMGGLLILLSLLSALLLWGNLQSHYFWLMFLTTATFAGIGGR